MSDELPRSPAEVRDTFEAIAVDFDRTRATPWSVVEAFVGDTGHAPVALDLGCGNGRHCEGLLGVAEAVYGVDISRALLEIARGRLASDRLGLLEATATAIPLPADAVDLAVYIATIHHLPDRSRRVASLDELDRVLAPGAPALVSGWSVHHARFEEHAAAVDRVVDWTLPSGERVPRFYHLYDEADFASELGESALAVDRRWLEAGNCYAAVRGSGKTQPP